MREKDDGAREKILAAAKAEFMEKGFADASMRTIAECAGFTTGMLYSRFADKAELFRELTQGAADALYNYFLRVQEDFARLPEQEPACTRMLPTKCGIWWISSTIISTRSN